MPVTTKEKELAAQNQTVSADADPGAFVRRHIGPSESDQQEMSAFLGYESLDALVGAAVPAKIRSNHELRLPPPLSEHEVLVRLREIAARNQVFRSYIGMGFAACITPPVIQREILENPGWYTQYTPYQAEIAQGRLEALLNFQTLVADLTALPVANASLLDEATACAEAMTLCANVKAGGGRGIRRDTFFVSADCHPQNIAVVKTRAQPLGIRIVVGDPFRYSFDKRTFAALIQYPATDGAIYDYRALVEKIHAADALVAVAADLLSLTLLLPPGEFGADVAVGSAQRFGVPLGYGGPHAAFFATREKYQRKVPGRIVGVSKDAHGRPALRLALQTREQHIRREKATSNICTAQALLAIMSAAYAVYHGPDGLRQIARRIHQVTRLLAAGLRRLGYDHGSAPFFDTLRVDLGDKSADEIIDIARAHKINLRPYDAHTIGVTLDETASENDVAELLVVFNGDSQPDFVLDELRGEATESDDPAVNQLVRTTSFLEHPVFHAYHSETEMLRYLRRLESRDLSLTTSMIPLGSCTMKLNAATEMTPITWPEFAQLHPFAPVDQSAGYQTLFADLEAWLAEITGLPAVSLQPNAGSQGEYAGLLAIRAYHAERGEAGRNVCLIPRSAHGTNFASAAMAGMNVVVVACDEQGNVDLADLRAKAAAHADQLAALMITYPSTHGVFEESIREICAAVHEHGGQVYMDGANLNAQVGLCRPGELGADVVHVNLHKTFCIPHGGGGPGMGPICVAEHLAPFLPTHPVIPVGLPAAGAAQAGGNPSARPSADGPMEGPGAIAATPWGSPSILVVSWTYIAMMGARGLTDATRVAILNANYIAKRLAPYYKVLYTGNADLVAHECILDLRPFKAPAGIDAEDVAKRLMDYGFHAPTLSWPVPGTLMVEPTESESKAELDRFCEAMAGIYHEIQAVAADETARDDNVLKNAPHTVRAVTADVWEHTYSREQAAYPAPWTREHKFWPPVGRIDNAYGDRNLVCSCMPIEDTAG